MSAAAAAPSAGPDGSGQTPAEQAEAAARRQIQDNLKGIELTVATGQLRGVSCYWKGLQERGWWLEPSCPDPLTNPQATLNDVYMRGQRYYLHHPLVSNCTSLSFRRRSQ